MWPSEFKSEQLSPDYRANKKDERIPRPRGRAPSGKYGEKKWDSNIGRWVDSISNIDNAKVSQRVGPPAEGHRLTKKPRGRAPNGENGLPKQWQGTKAAGHWVETETEAKGDSNVAGMIKPTHTFSLQNNSPVHRKGLYVTDQASSQGNRSKDRKVQGGALGLFTDEKIPNNEFVSFYTGKFLTKKQFDRESESMLNAAQNAKDIWDSYIMAVDIDKSTEKEVEELSIAVPVHRWFDNTGKINGSVNFETNPAAMINEPSKHKFANVYAKTVPIELDVNGRPDTFFAVCIYTCQEILAHEELLFHYGESVEMKNLRAKKGYEVGKRCKTGVTKKNDIYMENIKSRAKEIIDSNDDCLIASVLWAKPEDRQNNLLNLLV